MWRLRKITDINLLSACQVVGCLLLFGSWSFSTLLLAFSFAGDKNENEDSVQEMMLKKIGLGLTTGMPLLPSYSLLSEVFKKVFEQIIEEVKLSLPRSL